MKYFYFSLILLFSLWGKAQDVRYSQFYAAPLYLNPAFTGANSCSRFCSNYRQQWPGITGQFKSFVASYDHSFANHNSAVGLLFSKDEAGRANLGSTTGGLIYSYQIHLTRKLAVNAALQSAFTQRSINFYDLYFVDQLLTNSPMTVETPLFQRVSYFDLSCGMVVFSKRFWAGFSAHHLNTPNQAMLAEKSPLPVKYSVHSGIQVPVSGSDEHRRDMNKNVLTPSFNFTHQGRFNQLDIGMYYTYEPLVLGIWYRGIPVAKTFNNNPNNDALIITAGVSWSRLNFGYSYDITISKLAPSARGSHEISLSYQFCDPNALRKKRKALRVISCAKF